jgi:hypothetical protein
VEEPQWRESAKSKPIPFCVKWFRDDDLRSFRFEIEQQNEPDFGTTVRGEQWEWIVASEEWRVGNGGVASDQWN